MWKYIFGALTLLFLGSLQPANAQVSNCIPRATDPTYTAGVPSPLSCDLSGHQRVVDSGGGGSGGDVNLIEIAGSALAAVLSGADNVSNTWTGIPVYARMLVFDGVTWDRWDGGGVGGGGTEFDEDTPHTTGDAGTLILGVRQDSPAALAGTTGDYIPPSFDADNNLRVIDANPVVPGLLPSSESISGVDAVDQASRKVEFPNQSPCLTEPLGYAHVSIADDASTTVVIEEDALQNIYICSVFLFPAAAQNFALVADVTDNCASPDIGFFGGLTALTGQVADASGKGYVLPPGPIPWGVTAAVASDVCIMVTTAAQLSGVIVYVYAD